MLSKFYHVDLDHLDATFDKIRKEIELLNLARDTIAMFENLTKKLGNTRIDFDIFE